MSSNVLVTLFFSLVRNKDTRMKERKRNTGHKYLLRQKNHGLRRRQTQFFVAVAVAVAVSVRTGAGARRRADASRHLSTASTHGDIRRGNINKYTIFKDVIKKIEKRRHHRAAATAAVAAAD